MLNSVASLLRFTGLFTLVGFLGTSYSLSLLKVNMVRETLSP